MSAFREGDRILAQWDGGSFWFPGIVHSVAADGSVAVRYDDGMSDVRPANQVRHRPLVCGADHGRRGGRPLDARPLRR